MLDKRGIPLHPMIIQQREACAVPGDMVVDFIRTMKNLSDAMGTCNGVHGTQETTTSAMDGNTLHRM